MSASTQSRPLLAALATALGVSCVWILADISNGTQVPDLPDWRLTSQGWLELSEISLPPAGSTSGPVDNVSPWVWGAVLLFSGLAILLAFAEDGESAAGFRPLEAEIAAGRADSGGGLSET